MRAIWNAGHRAPRRDRTGTGTTTGCTVAVAKPAGATGLAAYGQHGLHEGLVAGGEQAGSAKTLGVGLPGLRRPDHVDHGADRAAVAARDPRRSGEVTSAVLLRRRRRPCRRRRRRRTPARAGTAPALSRLARRCEAAGPAGRGAGCEGVVRLGRCRLPPGKVAGLDPTRMAMAASDSDDPVRHAGGRAVMEVTTPHRLSG